MFRVIEGITWEGDYETLSDAEAHILEHDLDGWIQNLDTEKVKHFNARINEQEMKSIEYEIAQTMLGFPTEDDPDEGWITFDEMEDGK